MNVNRSLTLKEQFGPKSQAWQEQQSPPIVRFWCDDGACWGVPFIQVALTHYNPDKQTLLIHCVSGTIIVTGQRPGTSTTDFAATRQPFSKPMEMTLSQ